MQPGFYTTIQDYPGRAKYWSIGVPPSGPVDNLAFQTANAIVANDFGVCGLEMTLNGASLKFHSDTVIALTGAKMAGDIDGKEIVWYSRIKVKKGSILTLKNIIGQGFRSYLAVAGGFSVPDYLGSKATFCFGQFGGLHGAVLKAGDNLPILADNKQQLTQLENNYSLAEKDIPQYGKDWQIGVIYGPHGAPDFFTQEDIEMFFASKWKVHHNSNRLGIRLIGPKPKWARKDGGDAGLHPSNIHDCEYAVGTINFTGDMPIILNCDGPSLGGFVCPATIIQSEMWKLGQISANDTVQFKQVSYEQSLASKKQQYQYLENIATTQNNQNSIAINNSVAEDLLYKTAKNSLYQDAIVHFIAETDSNPKITYRIAGDNYLLIEYGELILDLNLRFRVHALMEWFNNNPVTGIWELSPGVRSVQIHYDSSKLHLQRLLDILSFAETQLPDVKNMVIDSRIIKLPLAFDDKWNKQAIEKYMQSITDKAPYLPDNIEFIARINGLGGANEVRDTIFAANYLVLGLGDVYLGAPCAVPIDPRHRLVTSKYNPARTYTPEGSVGIGGVYMCIYGMDSPGGYQLVGRTLPIWNKFTNNIYFEKNKPWLLRFFDQVQYYPVSDAELEDMREKFRAGNFAIEVEETKLKTKEINQFLEDIKEETKIFKDKQNIAFAKEREYWQESGMIGGAAEEQLDDHNEHQAEEIPAGCFPVHAHASGSVWDILVDHGDEVSQNQSLVILEAMKTEIKVNIDLPGKIQQIKVKKGQLVNQGDVLFIVKSA